MRIDPKHHVDFIDPKQRHIDRRRDVGTGNADEAWEQLSEISEGDAIEDIDVPVNDEAEDRAPDIVPGQKAPHGLGKMSRFTNHSVTPLERAFQLANSGHFPSVSDIRTRLRAEGFPMPVGFFSSN